MTLHRRGGLTARAGIIRRGNGLERRRSLDNAPPASAARRQQRAAALDVPVEARELLALRSRGVCEGLISGVCTGPAGDVHHRKRRRDGGHALTNLVHLCRACHAWAHAHPADARRLGLIVSAFEEPAGVPIRLLSRLTGLRDDVHLDDAGGYLVEGAVLHADGTIGPR